MPYVWINRTINYSAIVQYQIYIRLGLCLEETGNQRAEIWCRGIVQYSAVDRVVGEVLVVSMKSVFMKHLTLSFRQYQALLMVQKPRTSSITTLYLLLGESSRYTVANPCSMQEFQMSPTCDGDATYWSSSNSPRCSHCRYDHVQLQPDVLGSKLFPYCRINRKFYALSIFLLQRNCRCATMIKVVTLFH